MVHLPRVYPDAPEDALGPNRRRNRMAKAVRTITFADATEVYKTTRAMVLSVSGFEFPDKNIGSQMNEALAIYVNGNIEKAVEIVQKAEKGLRLILSAFLNGAEHHFEGRYDKILERMKLDQDICDGLNKALNLFSEARVAEQDLGSFTRRIETYNRVYQLLDEAPKRQSARNQKREQERLEAEAKRLEEERANREEQLRLQREERARKDAEERERAEQQRLAARRTRMEEAERLRQELGLPALAEAAAA